MKQKRKRHSNWSNRRVAFIVSDSWHKITPVTVKMPVRVKNRTGDKTVYEGPIAAKWIEVEKLLLMTMRHGVDLVGVLYASDDNLESGRIDWLEQSEITEVEAGAERMEEV